MDNPVRPYAWGSRTVIAELLGRPAPSAAPRGRAVAGRAPGRPVAPRRRRRPSSLVEASRADPEGAARRRPRREAGREPAATCSRCSPPTSRCSLQAHPSPAQAAQGFAARTPPGMPRRRADPQLPRRQPQARADLRAHPVRTRWSASGGPADTSTLLRALDVPAIAAHVRAAGRRSRTPPGCARCSPPGSRCRRAVLDGLVPAVAGGAACGSRATGRSAGGAHRRSSWRSATPATRACWPRCCSTGSRCSPARRSTCPRATCTRTCPGAGVELMANSDNVLRGGLTPKHVDVAGAAARARLRRPQPRPCSPGSRPTAGCATTRTPRSSCCAG